MFSLLRVVLNKTVYLILDCFVNILMFYLVKYSTVDEYVIIEIAFVDGLAYADDIAFINVVLDT
jgi:hypothetical protein